MFDGSWKVDHRKTIGNPLENHWKMGQSIGKQWENGGLMGFDGIGDWNMTFIFPYIGKFIIPVDSHFSEGFKPPTS